MHQLRQNTKINNMAIPKSSKMQMHTNKNCTEKQEYKTKKTYTKT